MGDEKMEIVSIVILLSYFLFMLAIGAYIFRNTKWTSEEFFVAGRSLGPMILFFTMAATNFSAFFFFGFAGASYTIGYAYYGMMAFGTAFTCINFYIIGDRVWRLGKYHSLVTPPELIGKRFESRLARGVFMIVMVVFTVPYIAVQPIGGGIALSSLSSEYRCV
jgi:SSS family solute:Na+ symporter